MKKSKFSAEGGTDATRAPPPMFEPEQSGCQGDTRTGPMSLHIRVILAFCEVSTGGLTRTGLSH